MSELNAGGIFCCAGFRNAVVTAGERGLSILVEKTPHGFCFLLQSRGIAYPDQVRLKARPSIELTVNVACSTGLRFCPWCGSNLASLAAARSDTLEALARDHQKFMAR